MPVASTIFDLQKPVCFGDTIHNIPVDGGYDHNYCLPKGDERKLAARYNALCFHLSIFCFCLEALVAAISI